MRTNVTPSEFLIRRPPHEHVCPDPWRLARWLGLGPRAPFLEAKGHTVHTPTLTGLGERQHLAGAVTGPMVHVADVLELIRWQDLSDVILVGHSYAGLIITGVAAQIPERIGHLVYLDAFVPTATGQGATAFAPPARAAEIRASLTPNGLVEPSGFERWAADPDDLDWLRKMTTPHPASCFDQGVELSGREAEVPHRTNIYCARHEPSPFLQFHERYQGDPRWICHVMDCLHDAMVEQPKVLSDVLLKAANP